MAKIGSGEQALAVDIPRRPPTPMIEVLKGPKWRIRAENHLDPPDRAAQQASKPTRRTSLEKYVGTLRQTQSCAELRTKKRLSLRWGKIWWRSAA